MLITLLLQQITRMLEIWLSTQVLNIDIQNGLTDNSVYL